MNALFVTLTDQAVFGEAYNCGFVGAGYTKRISPNTVVHLNADRIDDGYKPAIAVFSHGQRIEPMKNGYVYDLSRQEQCLLCVRGMQVDIHGRPQGFLVEVYKLQRHRKPERKLSIVH